MCELLDTFWTCHDTGCEDIVTRACGNRPLVLPLLQVAQWDSTSTRLQRSWPLWPFDSCFPAACRGRKYWSRSLYCHRHGGRDWNTPWDHEWQRGDPPSETWPEKAGEEGKSVSSIRGAGRGRVESGQEGAELTVLVNVMAGVGRDGDGEAAVTRMVM